MGTKFVTSLAKGDEGFEVGKVVARKALEKLERERPDLTILFSSVKYDCKEVVRGVREIIGNTPLIGCSTAGEFTEEDVEKGSVACGMISSESHKFFTGVGRGLKEDEISTLEEAASRLPSVVEGYPYLSAIVLIDGLAGKGEEAILAALNALGPNVKFSGGSAGDDLKFNQTYVFTDDQVFADAVSLALVASKVPVVISVKHGHSPISSPLTVTKAEKNIVYEIDGRPPFEVWKEYAREDAKSLGIDVDKLLTPEEIGTFLTRYEAGLLTGIEYKIRWPGGTSVTDGPICFPCAIPEGTVLRVMESRRENQIASARIAAENALKACKGMKLAGAVIFDCVCRAVILGDEFPKAIDGIKEVLGGIPIVGFETYGEIAMEMGQLSGFHNTTTVVLLIPE